MINKRIKTAQGTFLVTGTVNRGHDAEAFICARINTDGTLGYHRSEISNSIDGKHNLSSFTIYPHQIKT